MTSRVGPQMSRAIRIVAAHPGCSKLYVARQLHIAARTGKNNALGYDPINRAIRAGLIEANYSKGRYSLSVSFQPYPP